MAIPFGEQHNSGDNVSTTVYNISNSGFSKCVSTFNSASNIESKIQNASNSSKGKLESGRRIKVWKGVFNLSFHQTFIDAMDRGESTNMAEMALFTWKSVLPNLSTVGNLSRTLFSIIHPDIVTDLKP